MSKAIVKLKATNGAKIELGVTTGGQEPFVWLIQDDDSTLNRKDYDELLEKMLDLRMLLWGPK